MANLSVPPPTLSDMTTSQNTKRKTHTEAPGDTTAMDDVSRDVFEDPVRFLARFGIRSEVVADSSLPAAA